MSTIAMPGRDQQGAIKGLFKQIGFAAGTVEFYRHFLWTLEDHFKVFVGQSALQLFHLTITPTIKAVRQPHDATETAHQLLVIWI